MTSCNVEVVFLPSTGDGLLLYNGYSTHRNGDFISLTLRDGFVEYCFDLGTGPAIIRSLPADWESSVFLFQPYKARR